MKKIICIFLILVFVFTGCVNTENNDNTEEQVQLLTAEEYTFVQFDENKQELPTHQDIKNLKKGMAYSQVTEVLGLPQRLSNDHLIFELDDECDLFVRFAKNGESIELIEFLSLEQFTYEEDRQDLVTKKEAQQITGDLTMTYCQVIDKIGFPQRTVGSGIFYIEYDLAEGGILRLQMISDDENHYSVATVQIIDEA